MKQPGGRGYPPLPLFCGKNAVQSKDHKRTRQGLYFFGFSAPQFIFSF